ncbi:MAG: hypothetical protein KAS51_03575 [Candidatus Omnitrophica bacterium]|nr:hypothetical protein [Candidatus Omnitrophota bacterium]
MEECKLLKEFKTGEAKILKGYSLVLKYVIPPFGLYGEMDIIMKIIYLSYVIINMFTWQKK